MFVYQTNTEFLTSRMSQARYFPQSYFLWLQLHIEQADIDVLTLGKEISRDISPTVNYFLKYVHASFIYLKGKF